MGLRYLDLKEDDTLVINPENLELKVLGVERDSTAYIIYQDSYGKIRT